MGKGSSPARRRGSSTGKVRKSAPEKASEKLPKWEDDQILSPKNAEHRAAYGELLSRYEDAPPALRQKLIRSELTGEGFNLRLRDVVPKDGLKFQISGELYDELQTELAKNPKYTSLDFMRVLLYSDKLPMSTRFDVAKEMLPYEHAKNPAPAPDGDAVRAVLVVPGVVSVEDWEREAKAHRERLRKMEEGS